MSSPLVSVIIPLAAGEDSWRSLLGSLKVLPDGWEVLLASPDSEPDGESLPANCLWLQCRREGRAAQMNIAAEKADGKFLWFVHADSVLAADAPSKLSAALAAHPDFLHYFSLRFHDGGVKMRLNEFGANLRSYFCSAPFGDQAFCLAKATFLRLGGYPENAPYGEDHLLVRKARRQGVPLGCVGAGVSTSARKYDKMGWLSVVWLHQRLWIRQILADRRV